MALILRTAPVLIAVPLLLAACSSSGSGPSTSSTPPSTSPVATTSAVSSTPPTTSSAPSTPSAAGGLSGAWSGHYSGAFTGTFHLRWQQHSSDLTGTITLSSTGTVPLNGHVSGSHISFGTVGSQAITYMGTVSGDSMSGTYSVAGQGGGSWNATRS